MFSRVVGFDGLERTCTNVKGQRVVTDSSFGQRTQHVFGHVQTGGGGGNSSFLFSINGLIRLVVGGGWFPFQVGG